MTVFGDKPSWWLRHRLTTLGKCSAGPHSVVYGLVYLAVKIRSALSLLCGVCAWHMETLFGSRWSYAVSSYRKARI